MKVTLSTRMKLSAFKAPYGGEATTSTSAGKILNSVLFRAYSKTERNINMGATQKCAFALASLLKQFKLGYEPFFTQTQADGFFKAEVLAEYGKDKEGKGRYLPENLNDPLGIKFTSLFTWADLINNKVSSLLSFRGLIKEDIHDENNWLESAETIRRGLRTLQIIADWLYYHPEEQAKLRPMLKI